MDLPHVKRPCRNCPFRQDSLRGWLGKKRIMEILRDDSFVCHKDTNLQCAGHMLILGDRNVFVHLSRRFDIKLNLSGKELVFKSYKQCISHHSFKGTKL